MSPILEVSICILIFTTIVVLLFIGFYLINLLRETTKLAENLNDISKLLKQETEPLLNEIKQTLTTINNVTKSADTQIDIIKKMITGTIGASCIALGGLKNAGSFLKGIVSGFKFFSKK